MFVGFLCFWVWDLDLGFGRRIKEQVMKILASAVSLACAPHHDIRIPITLLQVQSLLYNKYLWSSVLTWNCSCWNGNCPATRVWLKLCKSPCPLWIPYSIEPPLTFQTSIEFSHHTSSKSRKNSAVGMSDHAEQAQTSSVQELRSKDFKVLTANGLEWCFPCQGEKVHLVVSHCLSTFALLEFRQWSRVLSPCCF